MKTAFDIFLILWLVASVGLWALGIGFGNSVLPPINVGTLLAIYAPWLILIAIGVRSLRARQKKTAE